MKISELIKKLQYLQEKHGSDTQIYTSGAFDDLHDITSPLELKGDLEFNSYYLQGEFKIKPKDGEIFIIL